MSPGPQASMVILSFLVFFFGYSTIKEIQQKEKKSYILIMVFATSAVFFAYLTWNAMPELISISKP